MPLIHWRRALLAVALLLASCKPNTSTAATKDAGVATAPAPGKAPTPAPAPAPVPASGPVLAYLKPAGSERCEWVRQPFPSGEPVTLFTFEVACRRPEVSWSPNGKEGLVRGFPRGASQRIWRVNLAGKSGKLMDL